MEPAAAQAPRGDAAESTPGRVLVSLLALGVPAAQLAFRAADDDRLTSWRWIFEGVRPPALLALVAVGIAAAHVLARAPFPPRRPAPVLFAAAFAVGACFWRAPEVIVDASRYFTAAKHLELHGLSRYVAGWGREFPAWTDLPLVPALYGIVLRVAGESRTALQALTTALFAGTVVLAFELGKELWDDEAGFAGAALLLAIPYLPTQVPVVLVDVPTAFFLALALVATVAAVRRGGAARVLLAAVAVALALLSKWSAWLLLSGLPLAALAFRREAPGALRRLAAVGGGAALLVAAALLPARDVVAAQLALLRGYQAPGLRRWGESFASTFLFQVHPFVTGGALLSAWIAARRRDARWLVVAWPVLLLAVLQVRRIRYWVPAFPMLAVVAGYGLQAIRPAAVRRLAVLCAVAGSLVVALRGALPFLARTSASNLEAAGAYLDGLDEPVVEVFAVARPGAEVNPAVSVPLLDLYTAKRLVYAYEPARPPPGVATSPLRFTWEYRNPPWYAAPPAPARAAVALVTDDLSAPLPPALRARVRPLAVAREFTADEGVFRHRTLVRVYRAPPEPAGSAP